MQLAPKASISDPGILLEKLAAHINLPNLAFVLQKLHRVAHTLEYHQQPLNISPSAPMEVQKSWLQQSLPFVIPLVVSHD